MADEGDVERMVFLLEARTSELEKGMKRADMIANKAYAGMKRDSRTATQQMEADMNRTSNHINRAIASTSTKIGTFGKTMIAGFAGGLVAGGLAGIVSRLGQVASAVASVGDEARRAGLGVTAFQELSYVAQQNRVGIDALTDGIKELNLRADEFIVTGGGSAAEAFERLGYGAEELNAKLQDPSALFTQIIGKLGELDQAAQIRIADELFGGTGGEQFVQLIAQGEEGIRRTIEEAHSLGIIMDEQVIAKAAEVDRKFNQIANTVGNAVQAAVVEVAFAMVDLHNALDVAIQKNRLLAISADAWARHAENMALVEGYFASAGRVSEELEAKVRSVFSALESGTKTTQEAQDELNALGAINLDAFPITSGLSVVIGQLDLLVTRAAAARVELSSLTSDPIGPGPTMEGVEALSFDSEPEPPSRPRLPSGGGGRGGGGRGGGAASQADAVKNLIAGLEMEREAIGLSAVDQERLTALRQAGAAATEEQKARITELIQAVSDERAAAELLVGDDNPFQLLDQQMAGLESMLQRGAISWEQYGEAARRAHMLAASTTLGAVGQITGALSQIFEGNKGFAVANAVVNTAQGITAALALPPPMGWIQAAAVAAAGAAQISTIMSTQKGSTTKPSVGKGGAASSGAAERPAAEANRAIELNLTLGGNGRYSRDEIRDLFEQLVEGINDGLDFGTMKVAMQRGGFANR